MTKYILATTGLFSTLLGIAYLHFMFGSYYSGTDASSDYIFSYGYVALLLGCVLAMSWGNISSFEDYQRSINGDKRFGLKLGGVFGVVAVLLMVTAAFI
ncbi:hypothetical protein [Psychromonas sp. Urea-02u-13]|uniref:hypothetical protein n=1 Tax=Psychromonas sp. Urea-02u-13 TaxID=2058326 RepID=UPI000C34C98F|nr:hypothetical protein [Psychromonas sp. Urea-02u-13]PKG38738.1 hypothetical protein CXF74_12390 [Psychromonas sp. Urea-02u-13]